MAKLKITQEDMLRGKLVEPGWYPVTITGVDEKQSKAGDSLNTIINMVVTEGNFAGIPLIRLFSEKAPGFAIPFLEALGVTIPKDGGEFEMKNAIGKKLNVYVKNDLWEGKMRNVVEGFRTI